MAKLRKAKNLSLVKDVSQQIEEAILTGDYIPGDRLPSTRALLDILGASLGTIRESLAILEQKGLLEVRKGSKGGFFVREISTEPLESNLEILMRQNVLSHEELYEFRTTNEVRVIQLVIQQATDDQIETLWGYLERMRSCIGKKQPGWEKFVDIENELRKEFLEITQNRAYKLLLTPLINKIQDYAQINLAGGDKETKLACEYWEKIIPAIANRDEDKASALLRELLFTFMAIIMEYSEIMQTEPK